MQVTLAEMIDRYSIVTLKVENLPENVECRAELATLENEIRQHNFPQVLDWFSRLYDTNSRIWKLEADIRNGRDGLLGLEEVGRRAIQIRDINSERIAIKNEINKVTKSGFQEIKVNHGSTT